MVEEYCRLQGLFLTPESPDPRYSEVLEVDLAKIEPSVAGPRNPEERRALRDVPSFARSLVAGQAKARKAATQQSPSRRSQQRAGRCSSNARCYSSRRGRGRAPRGSPTAP